MRQIFLLFLLLPTLVWSKPNQKKKSDVLSKQSKSSINASKPLKVDSNKPKPQKMESHTAKQPKVESHTAKQPKIASNVLNQREVVQKQIDKRFYISHTIKGLQGSSWTEFGEGMSDILRSLTPFFNGYDYTKETENDIVYFPTIYFHDNNQAEFHIQFKKEKNTNEKKDYTAYKEFRVPLFYVENETIKGLLHFTVRNKKRIFSLQVVSSDIMICSLDTVVEDKKGKKPMQLDVIFFRKNSRKSCVNLEQISDKKFIKYHQMEDYLLQTQHGIKSKSTKDKPHHFIIHAGSNHRDPAAIEVLQYAGFDQPSSSSPLSKKKFMFKCEGKEQTSYLSFVDRDDKETFFAFYLSGVVLLAHQMGKSFVITTYVMMDAKK